MTEIRDLIDARYRELLAAVCGAAPAPLPDLITDNEETETPA